jgi:hypothetical protein
MTNTIKYLSSTCIVIAFAALPASAQLGLGRATGSVTGAVQRTATGTVSQPGAIAGAGNVSGRVHGDTPEGALGVTQNAALSTRITPLLPASTSLPAAAAGFHSDSDFIETVHAAHNLNIPFEDLKAKTTGKGSVSLDSAIRKTRPDLDSKTVKDNVTLAQHQSSRDIEQAASAGASDRVSTRVTSDQRLAARLNPMVPSGQTLGQAAAGFKNEDQFMATLHAANDNHVDFADLKDRVTAGQSLGAAIHDMKPGMEQNASMAAAANAEAKTKNDKVEASASASAKVSAK